MRNIKLEYPNLSEGRLEFYEKMREENRLKILPCKIGDIVYVITECKNVYSQFCYTNKGYCPFNRQDTQCECCNDRIGVFEDVVTQIMIDELGIHIFVNNCAIDGILNQNIFLDKVRAKNALNDYWKNVNLNYTEEQN